MFFLLLLLWDRAAEGNHPPLPQVVAAAVTGDEEVLLEPLHLWTPGADLLVNGIGTIPSLPSADDDPAKDAQDMVAFSPGVAEAFKKQPKKKMCATPNINNWFCHTRETQVRDGLPDARESPWPGEGLLAHVERVLVGMVEPVAVRQVVPRLAQELEPFPHWGIPWWGDDFHGDASLALVCRLTANLKESRTLS